MHYFALLLGPEPTGEPDAAAAAQIMAAYQDFHTAGGRVPPSAPVTPSDLPRMRSASPVGPPRRR